MRKLLVIATVGALALTGCSDDGAAVRSTDSSSSACATGGTGSGVGSGAGTGSGSGVGATDASCAPDAATAKEPTTDDAEVLAGVQQYKTWAIAQVDATIKATTVFTDAVRAGDVEAAKAAYAPSRLPWESIEPVAGLLPDFDGAIDSRDDDFETPDDPKFIGWHKLEYLLWAKKDISGAKTFADGLDEQLQALRKALPGIEFTPSAVALGAGDLVEEVSKGKITGEEDRYSHTDLSDIYGNLLGAKKIIEIFTPVLQKNNSKFLTTVNAAFTTADNILEEYKDGTGWKPFTALTEENKLTLKGATADLAEKLAGLSDALGLK